MSTTPTFNAKFMDLPIVKSLGQEQLVTKVDNFRKGEKGLYNVLRIGTYGAIGYGIWTYVLPIAFVALGQLIALAITAALALFLFFAAPAIFSWIRIAARALHKSAIKYDPFKQLEIEKQKLIANQTTFRVAKQNIKSLQSDMGSSAERMKKEAETANENIFRLEGKAESLRTKMKEMVERLGVDAKQEDEYVGYASQLNKVLGDAQRVINKEKQSKDFMDKYQAREQVMRKMSQKLVMVESVMENKIADFDATVEFLKNDYEFAQKSNAATYAAKSAIGFSGGWERDYALEVIAESISNDTAMTAGNLRDIESLTSNYDLNSDDLFLKLDQAADRLRVDDGLGDFNKYKNPDYVMTEKDKRNSGGFDDMFN